LGWRLFRGSYGGMEDLSVANQALDKAPGSHSLWEKGNYLSPKTILLVEDNADDEELTLDALRTGGVYTSIIVVRDGAEAVTYLSNPAQPLPDLVLLDLRLPKIPGIDVLRRIRADERTRHIPTVILTSSSERSDMLTCYTLGANSFVRKPVEFEEFVGAVQRLGAYWVLVDEGPGQCL
jgi:two-component system, response regulator